MSLEEQTVSVNHVRVNLGEDISMSGDDFQAHRVLIDLAENRSTTFVHLIFDEQDRLVEVLKGVECQFEYAASHGLWYSSEVMPPKSWSVPLKHVSSTHYVCPLSHQNLTSVVALIAGLSSESLFLGLDIVRQRSPSANLAGSFPLGHHGTETVRKSIINRMQGRIVEEMNEQRSLPLLLVPVDWEAMLPGVRLLPEVAVLEQDDVASSTNVSFTVDCPASAARQQYLLYQLLPKQQYRCIVNDLFIYEASLKIQYGGGVRTCVVTCIALGQALELNDGTAVITSYTDLRVEINGEQSRRESNAARVYRLDWLESAGVELPHHEQQSTLNEQLILNGTNALNPDLAATSSFECMFQAVGGNLTSLVSANLSCSIPSGLSSLVQNCENINVSILYRNASTP